MVTLDGAIAIALATVLPTIYIILITIHEGSES